MLSAESSMNTISVSGPRAKNTEEALKDTYFKLLCILLLCVRLSIPWVSELDYRSDHSWYEASEML